MKIVKWQQGLWCFVAGLLVLVGDVGTAKAEDPPVNPQIVRVSYLQGDVRLSRGPVAEKATGEAWVKASVDVPLYTGFTLVTGADGRAEIEFEDSSRVYLAENSVLSFGDLLSVGNMNRTEISLVSGMMTLDAPTLPVGDMILVHTPVNGFFVKSPGQSFVRVNSFLDAMELTPMADHLMFHMASGQMVWKNGQTMMLFEGNKTKPIPVPTGTNAFVEWDAWVRARSAAHTVAMHAAMKDAGLDAPVPGLTEVAAQGTFFDCAPYGKCWEPNNGWDEAGAGDGASESGAEPVPTVTPQTAARTQPANSQAATGTQTCSTSTPGQCVVEDDFFPCSPVAMRNFFNRDSVTGKLKLIFTEQNISPRPYLWGVCHAGSWLRWHRRYVWVAGTHRHHHWGVRWVKVGGKLGYVPVHPRDITGKPPLNVKHGVYITYGKKGTAEKFVHVSEPVKPVKSTPKEFVKITFAPLPRVDAPHMEARQLHETSLAHPWEPVKGSQVVLSLDQKRQSFQVAQTVIHDGHEHTVTTPVGGRGSMAMNASGESHRSGPDSGFNNSNASSFSQPSSGAFSSGPVSSGSSGASIATPSGPTGGPVH